MKAKYKVGDRILLKSVEEIAKVNDFSIKEVREGTSWGILCGRDVTIIKIINLYNHYSYRIREDKMTVCWYDEDIVGLSLKFRLELLDKEK